MHTPMQAVVQFLFLTCSPVSYYYREKVVRRKIHKKYKKKIEYPHMHTCTQGRKNLPTNKNNNEPDTYIHTHKYSQHST